MSVMTCAVVLSFITVSGKRLALCVAMLFREIFKKVKPHKTIVHPYKI